MKRAKGYWSKTAWIVEVDTKLKCLVVFYIFVVNAELSTYTSGAIQITDTA